METVPGNDNAEQQSVDDLFNIALDQLEEADRELRVAIERELDQFYEDLMAGWMYQDDSHGL